MNPVPIDILTHLPQLRAGGQARMPSLRMSGLIFGTSLPAWERSGWNGPGG
ncbi:hypothetical protein [Amycolatopsis sp.]|uniref:hypothetical protein n=1 Tax=Amycolatopsis sp. TaxID=37632 RepID=UPI002C154D88|nr:hypothetical protein [Amycolatopsis sp.]HVV07636.1 hypothetical protein [Amycolatopsis sp.]